MTDREKENLISLLASNNDDDINLAHKMIKEMEVSEEVYLDLIIAANIIMKKTMNKQWELSQCKLHYKLDLKKQI